jgi:hypothetical protein
MKKLPNKLTIVILLMIFSSVTGTGYAAGKVTICHIPPGNPGNAHTITVSKNAVQAHMNHGDIMGPCSIISTGIGNIFTVCDNRKDEIGRRVSLTLTGRVQSQRLECD